MAFNKIAQDRPRVLIVGGGYVGFTVAQKIQKVIKESGGVVTVVDPNPYMTYQPFLPEVSEGDKRIVLIDGAFAGAINRKPGEGEFRSNLAVGGYAEAATLTAREEEICAVLGPELKARGLVFVGIDVIGGKWLTEINVTSPTGIVAIDRFNGSDTGGLIWDAIEERHAAMLRG